MTEPVSNPDSNQDRGPSGDFLAAWRGAPEQPHGGRKALRSLEAFLILGLFHSLTVCVVFGYINNM